MRNIPLSPLPSSTKPPLIPSNVPAMIFSGSSSSSKIVSGLCPWRVCVAVNKVPVIFPTASNVPPTTLDTSDAIPFANPFPNWVGPFKNPFLGSLINSIKPVPILSINFVGFLI